MAKHKIGWRWFEHLRWTLWYDNSPVVITLKQKQIMGRQNGNDLENMGKGEESEKDGEEEDHRLLANKMADNKGRIMEIEKATEQSIKSITDEKPRKAVKLVISICMIFGVAISWASATQFRKSTMVIDPTHFYAPYSMVWFSTSFMLLCYPVFLLYIIIIGKKLNIEHAEALRLFGKNGFSLRNFIWLELLFLFLWTASNYSYTQALGLISASAATSIMSANTAVVCLLGWALLKEPFSLIKTFAVFLAIAGVLIISMDNEFAGNILGIGIGIISACCAALYKVLFKFLNGSATLGQVSLFMSGLGLVNLTLNAIPTVLMVYFELDHFEWSHIPWLPLLGSAILGLVFNFLVNFGIVLLDPFVISIGMVFGIPLSAGIDLVFRSLIVTPKFISGSALVTLSFILIAFPIEKALKICCHRSNYTLNIKENERIAAADTGI